MRASNPTKRSSPSRWVTGLTALLLIAQLQGLLPLLFAGLAWVDGEHKVQLGSSDSTYQVVLRHDRNAAAEPLHSWQPRHCPVGEFLVALAKPVSGEEQDHVISFKKLEVCSLGKTISPVANLALVCADLPPEPTIEAKSCSLVYLPLASRPPPSPAATSFVRQTVLLI